MTRRFPKFNDHADVRCLNCDGPVDSVCAITDNAPGRGQWKAPCSKCQMPTWYDLNTADVQLRNFLKRYPEHPPVLSASERKLFPHIA